ncbi:type II toxin-antitoxin system RelE/ParE family toxin [Promicromonospora iranensis]|uniref:type II toxin-antitoxin system RelE/ParE family toxin n=1 Tax=Promicromonospora iranensis TaxID=1105144 RepID=UPI0023A9A806|nr:type II toxin-antitoxin system RelE/ParE family toxin [Promicromonospora iranensis]
MQAAGSAGGVRVADRSGGRPGSAGRSELRVLFAFDPARSAILLVAGDKAGRWRDWCRSAIPLADDRYDSHLKALTKKLDDGGAGTGGER